MENNQNENKNNNGTSIIGCLFPTLILILIPLFLSLIVIKIMDIFITVEWTAFSIAGIYASVSAILIYVSMFISNKKK